MADRIYKKVTVVGCSAESIQKAVEIALEKTAENLHGLAWFEVREIRGAIESNRPLEWQVTVDVNFKVD